MKGIKITGQVIFDSNLNSHLMETNHICWVLGSLRKVDGLPSNCGNYLQCTFSWWFVGRIFSGFDIKQYQVLYFLGMSTSEMILKGKPDQVFGLLRFFLFPSGEQYCFLFFVFFQWHLKKQDEIGSPYRGSNLSLLFFLFFLFFLTFQNHCSRKHTI